MKTLITTTQNFIKFTKGTPTEKDLTWALDSFRRELKGTDAERYAYHRFRGTDLNSAKMIPPRTEFEELMGVEKKN